jgi:hypothetical protein
MDRKTWETLQTVKVLLRLVAGFITDQNKPIAWHRFTDDQGNEMLIEVWLRPWSEREGAWPKSGEEL